MTMTAMPPIRLIWKLKASDTWFASSRDKCQKFLACDQVKTLGRFKSLSSN